MTKEPISGKPPTYGLIGWMRQESSENSVSFHHFLLAKNALTKTLVKNRSLLHSVDRQDRHQESLVLQCQEW